MYTAEKLAADPKIMLGILCLTGEHYDFALVDVEAGHAQILDFHLVRPSYQSAVRSNNEPFGAVEGQIAGNRVVLEIHPRMRNSRMMG